MEGKKIFQKEDIQKLHNLLSVSLRELENSQLNAQKAIQSAFQTVRQSLEDREAVLHRELKDKCLDQKEKLESYFLTIQKLTEEEEEEESKEDNQKKKSKLENEFANVLQLHETHFWFSKTKSGLMDEIENYGEVVTVQCPSCVSVSIREKEDKFEKEVQWIRPGFPVCLQVETGKVALQTSILLEVPQLKLSLCKPLVPRDKKKLCASFCFDLPQDFVGVSKTVEKEEDKWLPVNIWSVNKLGQKNRKLCEDCLYVENVCSGQIWGNLESKQEEVEFKFVAVSEKLNKMFAMTKLSKLVVYSLPNPKEMKFEKTVPLLNVAKVWGLAWSEKELRLFLGVLSSDDYENRILGFNKNMEPIKEKIIYFETECKCLFVEKDLLWCCETFPSLSSRGKLGFDFDLSDRTDEAISVSDSFYRNLYRRKHKVVFTQEKSGLVYSVDLQSDPFLVTIWKHKRILLQWKLPTEHFNEKTPPKQMFVYRNRLCVSRTNKNGFYIFQ